jgi:hypothetical protein
LHRRTMQSFAVTQTRLVWISSTLMPKFKVFPARG